MSHSYSAILLALPTSPPHCATRPVFDILIGAEDDTGNGLLPQRTLVVLDRSLPADQRFSVPHHGRAQMLDHILANRPTLPYFQVLEAHNETLGDELVSFARVRQEPGSAHAPIVAEFDIP